MHFRPADGSKAQMVIAASIIGLLIGIVVSCFRAGIEWSLHQFQTGYQLAHHNWWWLLIILATNLLIAVIVGWLTHQVPAIKGSGIPQVEGQLASEYEAKWWPVLWRKFIGGLAAIGSGLMLGREGPSIQLGASVGQGFAEQLHYNPTSRRVMIASGAAAGLAAAFNAPIASTLFIIEEIYHNFSPLVWISALASSITANLVSLYFFGLRPVLAISYVHPLPLNQYWQLLALGIVLGILGRFYQWTLLNIDRFYAFFKGLPTWLNGIIPFVLVLPIGYFWADTLGGGNHLITTLSSRSLMIGAVGLLILLRFFFSILSYGAGLPGGIFLPILTIGALIGAFYLKVTAGFNLIGTAYLPNFIIYAMAGYFAGIGKAPFTAILLITEMVGSLSHLMPLAVVSLVAYLVVDMMGGEPIYESLLHKLVPSILAESSGKQDRLEVPIMEGATLDGHSIREFEWPKPSLLIGIRRGETTLIPNGDTVIKVGDTLIVTTQTTQRARIKHLLDNMAGN